MSVISDLSQHKKNVVIDLFGNSKDIYHRMKNINNPNCIHNRKYLNSY